MHRVAVWLILTLALPLKVLPAQNVHILFMQSTLSLALKYKKDWKVDRMDAFMAAGLAGISEARTGAYLRKISSSDAVLILGEESLEAAGRIPFPMPVIIVNAVGHTAATGPVFRVLDTGFAGTVEGARVIVSVAEVSAGPVADGNEATYQCEGVPAGPVIGALLLSLARK